jgi:NOL1/NOP2/fmu family ribosome biogenesis protein
MFLSMGNAMAHSARLVVSTLVGLVAAGLAASNLPAADDPAPKPPQWTHALDLKARKSTEAAFTDKTRTFGVEVFRDDNDADGIYLVENGSLAVVPNFKDIAAPLANSKAPEWMHGLDLKVRKAGEPEFTAKTQVFSLEVFRDVNTGNWIYLTETGALAVVPGAQGARGPTPSPKAPQWVHGLDLKCRRAGEKEFTNDTRVYSLEVFRDENNGNLIYITETGAIAVLPGAAGARVPTADSKAPEWMHGLDLKVRKAGEKDFTSQTKAYGIEVFRDANNANWIYLAETGNLAVLAGNKALPAPTPRPREPKWTHGLDLKVRKAGEHDFTPQTRAFGVEVFRDENTGTTVYISETGAISAVPTR